MLTQSDSAVDIDWCPVCDRAILPARIDIPTPTPDPARFPKASGGLVNGTGRGLRRPPPSRQPPTRVKTVISHAPTSYYCSEECRNRDLADELLRLRLSDDLFPTISDLDLDFPAVPHNSPTNSYTSRPPTPHFSSSGTDSDSSDPSSYSPATALKNLPPLSSLKTRPATPPRRLSKDDMPWSEYSSLRAIAARPASRHASRASQSYIQGWTDGDKAKFRASIYGGAHSSVPHVTAAPSSRREERNPPRRPAGYSAPQTENPSFAAPYPPKFRRADSLIHLPCEETAAEGPILHPLLSSSHKGRLLVPKLRHPELPRSDSGTSIGSSKRESRSVKSAHAAGTDGGEREANQGAFSWSHSGQFVYPMPPRNRKEKRLENVWVPSPGNNSGLKGVGEGRWEQKEVEVIVQAERKRLFLFGD